MGQNLFCFYNQAGKNHLKGEIMGKNGKSEKSVGKVGYSKPIPNLPSKTGKPSGRGRGNCPPKK
jgi:hypothetical protein